MPRCMAQDLEASHINHIALRTAVNSKFPCVATVWRLDWDAKSGFALRSIQQTPRVDRPPSNSRLRIPRLFACHSGAALDQAVFGRFKPQASRSLVRQGARQRMSKRLYQDPMVRTCAGCSKKAEHLTDLGTINKAVWHFQIPQEFTLPPSGRVKRGSHHLIWLVFS